MNVTGLAVLDRALDRPHLRTLSLTEAAALLRMHPEEVRRRAKCGGIWWIDVVAPNGERIRRTTETANKAQAQEFHDRLKSELWRIGKLGEKPRRTWNEAVVRWLKEQSHKATAGEDVTKLRWLDQYLGGQTLDTISRAQIDK